MADEFELHNTKLDDPAKNHYTVTPSDTVDLPSIPRCLYVDVGGTAAIVDEDGVEVSYTFIAGAIVPFRAVRIKATGTTATLIAWY